MYITSDFAVFMAHLVVAFTFILLLSMSTNEYFWNDYFFGQGVYVNVIVILASYMLYLVPSYLKTRTLGQYFDEVQDLIKSTIVVDLKDMWEAYAHFKTLKGIRIIQIKDLETVIDLQNVTVLFVFDERFIGEI